MYGWESGPNSTDLYCNTTNTTERECEQGYFSKMLTISDALMFSKG